CSNVAVCNPLVDLYLRNNSMVGNVNGNDPSTKFQVTYKGPGQKEATVIPVGTHVILDRSAGPIEIRLELSRADRHVGASNSKPWVIQAINLSAHTALAPTGAVSPATPAKLAKSFIEYPTYRYYSGNPVNDGRITLGQIPADLRQVPSPKFDARF